MIYLETDVLMPLAGTGRVFALQTNNWWSQLKTAGSAIYANRHYLELYRSRHADRLAQGDVAIEDEKEKKMCNIIGDVYIHPSASIHPTAAVSIFKYS
jgi:Nucleoside-diphosphate-sugar pyrophosphorylase involved in lipopolysaccharide biosynthesis/translation initiation factor 2B, gamma/epsilon subunits (eIF-2Bgamma/eIF-2Bepsilon)